MAVFHKGDSGSDALARAHDANPYKTKQKYAQGYALVFTPAQQEVVQQRYLQGAGFREKQEARRDQSAGTRNSSGMSWTGARLFLGVAVIGPPSASL